MLRRGKTRRVWAGSVHRGYEPLTAPRHSLSLRGMMNTKPIKKAVFPVAGLGTRFLPATKAIPKEMLPIIDRPLIQHAVDEAREAGREELIFVPGRGKTAIIEHFDIAFELEATPRERAKDIEELAPTRATPGTVISVR